MRVLVIGSGGREHAIIWSLSKNQRVKKIFCAPGNGGIRLLAECINIQPYEMKKVVAFSKEQSIDLVVVAPDDPLAAGMVDELEKNNVKAFGPNQKAALIEASKSFSKDLMKKYEIPTAQYEVFEEKSMAIQALQNVKMPVVVKADGLALGKGVFICETFEQAKEAVVQLMDKRIFRDSGSKVVIEEFLEGEEVSVLAFTDGKSIKPMVSAQDHKRAYDGDKGPNTGGMGTFAPSGSYDKELQEVCMKKIFQPTIQALEAEGRPFKGVLFFGLMITCDGPKVLEYNARFGDPETQVVLPLMKTDLLDIMEAILEGRLSEMNIEFKDQSAVCVVLASGGYPIQYEKNKPIHGLEGLQKALDQNENLIFHAGTKLENERYLTDGGRVLGVTAVASSHQEAKKRAYEWVDKICFDKMHYRKDIGDSKA
jgi:phosphoribosylamine--glycine ligase